MHAITEVLSAMADIVQTAIRYRKILSDLSRSRYGGFLFLWRVLRRCLMCMSDFDRKNKTKQNKTKIKQANKQTNKKKSRLLISTIFPTFLTHLHIIGINYCVLTWHFGIFGFLIIFVFLIFHNACFWRYIRTCALCSRQWPSWTHPLQGSSKIRRRLDVESWGAKISGMVNIHLIYFWTWWILT